MKDLLESPLIVDASPLISFLKIDRFDLLETFNRRLICTDFVRREVKHPHELLDNIINMGKITEQPLTEPLLLLEMEQLYERGLGRGEASSIVLAKQQGYGLILDDKRATRIATGSNLRIYSTAEVIVRNIQLHKISLSEADGLIGKWHSLGEFPVTFKTFKHSLFQD